MSFIEKLCVKRLSEYAIIPSRGSRYSAGYDLSSAENTIVPARGKALVKTDLSISIPENTYARIAPRFYLFNFLFFFLVCSYTLVISRSGLAWKNSIDVGAGVVDYDYRGNVGVILFNLGDVDFNVSRGDRIAQLILERISMADIEEVDELPSTDRGEGGFGSTGTSITSDREVKKMRKGLFLLLIFHNIYTSSSCSSHFHCR